MSTILPHRSGMRRRRFLGGLLALVVLGAVAVAPMPSASASSSGIHFNVQSGFENSVDTDGDGASDEAEAAFGSDPNDASDFPAVQAGPEATAVTALPNTGAQPHDDDDSSALLLLVSGAIAAGGLAGTRRLRNSR